jgi:hypothetical protein
MLERGDFESFLPWYRVLFGLGRAPEIVEESEDLVVIRALRLFMRWHVFLLNLIHTYKQYDWWLWYARLGYGVPISETGKRAWTSYVWRLLRILGWITTMFRKWGMFMRLYQKWLETGEVPERWPEPPAIDEGSPLEPRLWKMYDPGRGPGPPRPAGPYEPPEFVEPWLPGPDPAAPPRVPWPRLPDWPVSDTVP